LLLIDSQSHFKMGNKLSAEQMAEYTMAPKAVSFYNLSMKDIDGSTTKFDAFKGKVCICVNVASK